ncbi:hypothetical protein GGS24DRAFT_479079 [Hypoxylon argillaceum]|nr:hypothetical protein GGS24DRAFT_479079 [Hypoxylon argillaceum]
MASHNKRPELQFMVKTSMNDFHPSDRKLIRSHVMKGKNQGRMRPLGSRRYRELVNARGSIAAPSSSIDESNHTGLSRSKSNNSLLPSEDQTSIQASEPIPPLIGSPVSPMYLADSVNPAMVKVVLQLSSIAKQLLFSIEKCMFFDRRAENWIAPLAVDPVFLHAKVFTSLYYYDVVLPQRPSHDNKYILYHYHKTVSLLRWRLLYDDDEIRLSNNTVSVILSLASHAFRTGELELALYHMQGIRRIINLRGGLSTFKGNEKLAAEILRCDLGMVVHNGVNSVLLRDTMLWDTYRRYPKLGVFLDEKSLNRSSQSRIILNSLAATQNIKLDSQLASAWSSMSDFCCVINLAAETQQRINVETFLHSMASIMYNLLDMHFEASSWDETIRLGLLSFSCSVFLPWSHLATPLPHLHSILRNHFTSPTANVPPLPPKLLVWLLMASAVTVAGESDSDWIYGLMRDVISSCEIECWNQMKDMLTSLMWIEIVHDKLGKRVFQMSAGLGTLVPSS